MLKLFFWEVFQRIPVYWIFPLISRKVIWVRLSCMFKIIFFLLSANVRWDGVYHRIPPSLSQGSDFLKFSVCHVFTFSPYAHADFFFSWYLSNNKCSFESAGSFGISQQWFWLAGLLTIGDLIWLVCLFTSLKDKLKISLSSYVTACNF